MAVKKKHIPIGIIILGVLIFFVPIIYGLLSVPHVTQQAVKVTEGVAKGLQKSAPMVAVAMKKFDFSEFLDYAQKVVGLGATLIGVIMAVKKKEDGEKEVKLPIRRKKKKPSTITTP